MAVESEKIDLREAQEERDLKSKQTREALSYRLREIAIERVRIRTLFRLDEDDAPAVPAEFIVSVTPSEDRTSEDGVRIERPAIEIVVVARVHRREVPRFREPLPRAIAADENSVEV
jgi:hypothetical protein